MPDDVRLRVVRGDPTAEELAALLAVLAARTADSAPPRSRPASRSAWIDRAAGVRRPLAPGSGAWRASAWPR